MREKLPGRGEREGMGRNGGASLKGVGKEEAAPRALHPQTDHSSPGQILPTCKDRQALPPKLENYIDLDLFSDQLFAP